MKSGIYKIYNTITEKCYVGSAVNLKSREYIHKSNLRNDKHCNTYLQRSWNLHGEEAFEFIILEYCEREVLIEREQYWIDKLNCVNPIGYNANPIAGSRLGAKVTPEQLARMKAYKATEETKIRMSKARKGILLSQEHSAKISASNKGKPRDYCRKSDKWPHAGGYNCKCIECKEKKKLYMAEYNKTYIKPKYREFIEVAK